MPVRNDLNPDATKEYVNKHLDISKFENLPEEEKEKLRKALHEASDFMMGKENKPVKAIYVDIKVIQDITLGAIMTRVKNEEDHQYVLSKIPEYNARQGLQVSQYFNKLVNDDNEIEAILDDPSNHRMVSLMSPSTEMMEELVNLTYNIFNHNAQVNSLGSYEIYINTYPVQYDDRAKSNIINYIKHYAPESEPIFICEHQSDVDREIYEKCTHLFFYNINDFIGMDSPLAKDISVHGAWLGNDKNIMGINVVPEDIDTKGCSYLDTIANTVWGLNTFMNFDYMRVPKIPILETKKES